MTTIPLRDIKKNHNIYYNCSENATPRANIDDLFGNVVNSTARHSDEIDIIDITNETVSLGELNDTRQIFDDSSLS